MAIVEGASARPTTVLVAEDEALIRMDLVEMLGECGYLVVGQVADGQSAVDQARALRPDVVLLDVAMPRRDGLSAAEEIIAERIAPVVMVTAFSQRPTVERASAAGAFGYLVKPFGKADLPPAIEVAISRWRQMIGLGTQVDHLQERLGAQAVVERAKAVLQAGSGVTEAEAFAMLRRAAMDSRTTLAEAAAAVLAGRGSSSG